MPLLRKNLGVDVECSVSLDYLAPCVCGFRVKCLLSVREFQLCSDKVATRDNEWPEYSLHLFFGSLALHGEKFCTEFQAISQPAYKTGSLKSNQIKE